MKSNRFTNIGIGLLCLVALAAGPALAQSGYVERGYAILQDVDLQASTVVFKGNQYTVTGATELINEVKMPAQLNEFDAMTIIKGVPDRESGSKVYFEADFDHKLLKLRIVDEIPS